MEKMASEPIARRMGSSSLWSPVARLSLARQSMVTVWYPGSAPPYSSNQPLFIQPAENVIDSLPGRRPVRIVIGNLGNTPKPKCSRAWWFVSFPDSSFSISHWARR